MGENFEEALESLSEGKVYLFTSFYRSVLIDDMLGMLKKKNGEQLMIDFPLITNEKSFYQNWDMKRADFHYVIGSIKDVFGNVLYENKDFLLRNGENGYKALHDDYERVSLMLHEYSAKRNMNKKRSGKN